MRLSGLLTLLIFVAFTTGSCQKEKLITYFPKIKNDSIISTRQEKSEYFEKLDKYHFPDSVTLRYFFSNEVKNMLGEDEGYNADDNSYTRVSFIKKACPLHKKKHDNFYLLHYGIESILYLAIYDPDYEKILSTIVVSDFSDDMGNMVTHSTIFPNDYIVTTEINEKTYHELIRIDFRTQKFIELKKIESKSNTLEQEKLFQEAFKVLGITQKGELIE